MEIAKQVMDFAEAHYNEAYVWSSIVECWEVSELAGLYEEFGIDTLAKALAHHRKVGAVLDDRIAEAEYQRSMSVTGEWR